MRPFSPVLISEFCGSKTIAAEENCPPPTLKLTLTLTQTLNPTGRKSSSEFRISTIKMLENHWAFFLTQLVICRRTRNRELAWIALKIGKKTFLKVLNKTIILKYPLKTNRKNQSSEVYLEPSWTSTMELFLARNLYRRCSIGF